MPSPDRIAARVFIFSLLLVSSEPLLPLERGCEFSFAQGNYLYNYRLAAPSRSYPHGVMSEDGFYRIAVNETMLWYQLCDHMIFNHGQPKCLNCQDCGGPLHCGTQCSALVENNIGGYPVCTTIGQASNVDVSLIEKNKPEKGVIVKMVASGSKENCSLSVSVICDLSKVQASNSLTILGDCDYATELKHPSGCARVISGHGKGWGWFGTLMIIILCLLGGYLLVGASYRHFFLGIRGAQAIPYLEFWLSLPQRAGAIPYLEFWLSLPQRAGAMLSWLVRRLRGFSASRSSYAPLRDDRDFYASANY